MSFIEKIKKKSKNDYINRGRFSDRNYGKFKDINIHVFCGENFATCKFTTQQYLKNIYEKGLTDEQDNLFTSLLTPENYGGIIDGISFIDWILQKK